MRQPSERATQPRPSYWLDEAAEAGLAADAAPKSGDPPPSFDVTVVGGGYTGLWTAYFLSERAPGARIAIVEARRIGDGPSGRNGGFVHGWWDRLGTLERLFGAEAALAVARASDASVDGIGAFCRRHGVDAWYRLDGYLRTSTGAAYDEELRTVADVARRLGCRDALVPLTGAEVERRVASPRFRAGVLMPHAGTVQPARLALGLRRVLAERGVTILEGRAARRLRVGHRVRVELDDGALEAEQVVLALNAWAAGWPGFRTRLLTWGSWIVLTPPIPDRLAALGWTGGEAVADSRFTVRYFRTTPDGRVAFGGGVGRAGFGGRIGPGFDDDGLAIERVTDGLRHVFPSLADVPVERAWGGPIDVSGDRLPVVGRGSGGRVHWAHGYSGNGVAPAHLAGRILAARLDGVEDDLTRLPIVDHRSPRLPPEPMRFVGARIVREALIRRDDALEAGRRPHPLVRMLAALPGRLGYRMGG